MSKEEILTRAKNEKIDEMEAQFRDKSIKWTYLTMVLAAGIFAFVRAQRDQSIADLCATVCASVAAGQFYRYIKIKDKQYLIMAVITAAVGIFAAVRFCLGH